MLRREAELADGHAEYRFSGYVTVTAGDREGLEAACVETEQAAQRAQLELCRLVRTAGGGVHLDPAARAGAGLSVRKVKPPPAHRATTAQLQAVYPFVRRAAVWDAGAVARPGPAGRVVLLRSVGSVSPGPADEPQPDRPGPGGRGKSTFVKTFVWRQVAFGRQAWIVDPKGEYGASGRGVRQHALAPGARRGGPPQPARPGSGPFAGRHPASSAALIERPGTRTGGCRRRSAPAGGAGLLSGGVVAGTTALVPRNGPRSTWPSGPSRARVPPTHPRRIWSRPCWTPSRSWPPTVRTDPAGLAHDGRLVALELRRLVEGDLAGMFDGPTSSGLRLDASGRGPRSVGGVRLAGTALADDLRHRLAAGRPGARPGTAKRLVVVDEAWAVLHDLATARWLQATFKLARSLGVANVAVVHRLSDLRAAGAAGSTQQRLAEGLLADTETRVLFGQAACRGGGQPPAACTSPAKRPGLVAGLPRGVALWKVGHRSFLVEHRVGPLEADLVDTDAAMRDDRS